jgi:UDP-N-acetylglucosamine diphosphorylase/glucosamine-1-phosphate N-acetyltransferase
MNIGIFEDGGFRQLLPLTWLRSPCELVCGRDRLVDKVLANLGGPLRGLWVREELRELVSQRLSPSPPIAGDDWCIVNARAHFKGPVAAPPPVGTAWLSEGELVAVSVLASQIAELNLAIFRDADALAEFLQDFTAVDAPPQVRLIEYPWELMLANGDELRWQLREGGVQNGHVYSGAHLIHPDAIHVAAGARIKPGAVLDAEDGPIHIAENVLIEPNAVVQGPCFIGRDTIIRPGAAIRGNATIGPVCRVGGEVEGSIIHGYSNKQHDGFLGHSYIGCWVNLGADTVTSDLKNTYGTIRVALNGVEVESGERFIGSIIGDHAKTGIGTILPTGCVIGVAANVFTRRPVPKFVPSLAWLTDEGLSAFRVEKAVEIARTVMGRRKVELSAVEQAALEGCAALAREVERQA